MSSVFVVELLIGVQGMPVPKKAAVQEFVAARLHPSLHD
jgi:hypothetical protein